MRSSLRVIVVCLGLATPCSCRHVMDPDGLTQTGQVERIGLLTFMADTTEFTTYDAIARQISSVPDAQVSLRIESAGQVAYFDAQVRVIITNSNVVLMSLYLRFGDFDSSARFYQIRLQSNQFSSTLRVSDEGVIEGTFSGLLDGTGTNAFGKTLLIRNGRIRAPWKPTVTP